MSFKNHITAFLWFPNRLQWHGVFLNIVSKYYLGKCTDDMFSDFFALWHNFILQCILHCEIISYYFFLVTKISDCFPLWQNFRLFFLVTNFRLFHWQKLHFFPSWQNFRLFFMVTKSIYIGHWNTTSKPWTKINNSQTLPGIICMLDLQQYTHFNVKYIFLWAIFFFVSQSIILQESEG